MDSENTSAISINRIIENDNKLANQIPADLNCCISFINKLYAKKYQWVRRFIVEKCLTLNLMLGHVKTTQRNESLNRVIAEDTSPSNGLVETFESLYERQKLRFIDLRANLISEVSTSIPTGIVHPLFQELLLNSTKFISKKIRDEISQVNEYVIEIRPPSVSEGLFVIKRNHRVPNLSNQEESSNMDAIFRNMFKLGSRNVTSKFGTNGRLYYECTCMLAPIRGYPCRHILFIYATECTLVTAQEKLAPIMSYLHSNWLMSSVLTNFQITLKLPENYSITSSQSQVITKILSADKSAAELLLKEHEIKINEVKVSELFAYHFI